MEFKQALTRNLTIALTLIAALFLFLLLIGNDISGRVENIQNDRRELSFRLQSLESLAALRSGSEKADKLFATIQNFLPPRDQLVGFSKILENFARNNQLGFGFKFESEIPSAETAPGINNFILTSSGAYSNFLRFLKAAEDSKYSIGFTSFDILKKDKDFQMLIKGRVFSQ